MSSNHWLKIQINGLLLFSCFAVAANANDSESAVAQELSRVTSANEAMESLVSARLQLEEFHLQQLTTLLEQGHASWIEVARQQVVVDSLADQRESLLRFSHFIEGIVDQTHSSTTAVSQEKDSSNPIKVFLPESSRLVGWIEQDVVDLLEMPHAEADGKELADLIRDAKEKFEQKQVRCQRLDDTPNSREEWRTRARLQMQTSRAEWELLKLQQHIGLTNSVFQVSFADNKTEDLLAEVLQPVTMDCSRDLQSATIGVAWAEANATAMRDAAAIRVRQAQYKLDAITILHEEGHATSREKEQCRLELEDVRTQLDEGEKQLKQLTEMLRAMTTDHKAVDENSIFDSRIDLDAVWPRFILNDSSRLAHLIVLRRRYHDLEGRSAALRHQLKMKREYLERLTQATVRQQTSISNHESNPSKLQRSLANGQEREKEKLQLDIEYLEKRVQGTDQRIAIAALEEKRFLTLCEHMRHDAPFAPINLLRPEIAASGVLWQPRVNRNYLESKLSLARADGLILVRHCPEYFSFHFDQRFYSPLVYSNRHPLYIRRGDRRVSPLWYMDYSCQSNRSRVCIPSIANSYRDRDRKHCYRFGPYTTQSLYPHGILRADLRHKLPLGYPPWYLPGSPTNLQRW